MGIEDKNEPMFQILVKCPVCAKPEITAFELKSKTFITTPDRFQVPRYQPMGTFRAINYSLCSVIVCPQCLFASPDKKDFITRSIQSGAETKSQLGPFVLEDLKKKTAERKATLATVLDPVAYFKIPRDFPAAIAAYRLAVQRALVECELEVPLSYYKAGMYGLRIALLERDSGKPDEATLEEAAKALKASYSHSEVTSPDVECQLLYVIVALHIRLKDWTESQSYLTLMEKMKSLPESPSSLNRWLDLSKDLWTHREDPKIWEH